MTNYVQKSSKLPPIPPVTKTGIKEHLLAIVATCDLVGFILTSNLVLITYVVLAVSIR